MRLVFVLLFAARVFAQPHLLLNAVDFERIHKLAASQPWAASAVAEIVGRADGWPADHVREYGLKQWDIPREGAGWSHDYVCPVHGVRLKQTGGKNICPVDGKDYHGWPVDNVVYMQRNDDNARAARDLGLAYRFTGKAEYVEKARRIFRAYAGIYLSLPIHDNQNRPNTKTGARIMSQTLSEAKWLVPLAWGYDLVRDAVPAEERREFETKVLRGAAAVITRNDAGKSNWQSWHNAALLSVGAITGDRSFTELAVNGPSGFRFQLREGITPDGPWHEGSWGYHFFALDPLMLTREMAARAGLEVPEQAGLKRMLDAPLVCVFPDGTLPNFNDSGGDVKLDREARFYEIGYRLFHDPRYLVILAGSARGMEALFWGAESLPAGKPEPLSSEVLRDAGVATLRVRGSDYTVAIKFGEHGGGHGHFDKLTFVSYANGTHLGVDPGTQAYGAKSHATWDKMTVAHNTIVVDEKTQAAATGKLLEWIAQPSFTAIRVAAGAVYPNVELERRVVLTAEYMLEVTDARATDGNAHRFDWVYHNFGVEKVGLAMGAYAGLPGGDGYQHLTDVKGAETGDTWRTTFSQEASKLRVTMLGAAGTEVVEGMGLGPDLRVPVPFVMARRRGVAGRFVAVYEPYKVKPVVTGVAEVGRDRYEIRGEGFVDTVSFVEGRFEWRRVGR